MEIKKVSYQEVDKEFKEIKPDLLDCNVDSLKHFINNGYSIEKALFKVVKN